MKDTPVLNQILASGPLPHMNSHDVAVAKITGAIRFLRYPIIATYPLVLYEFAIMFDSELRYVYRSRWTLLKCFYLACRYLPILLWPIILYGLGFNHDVKDCFGWVVAMSVAYILLLSFPQAIYILRAWSITGRKPRILILFICLLAGYAGVLLYTAFVHLKISRIANAIIGRTSCLQDTSAENRNVFWPVIVAGIMLDVIVSSVVLVHCVRMRSVYGKDRLGRLVLAQGVLFFPVMLALNLLTGLIFGDPNPHTRTYDTMAFAQILVIPNIMACRFVIQIREYASPEEVSEVQMVSLELGDQRASEEARRRAEAGTPGLAIFRLLSRPSADGASRVQPRGLSVTKVDMEGAGRWSSVSDLGQGDDKKPVGFGDAGV